MRKTWFAFALVRLALIGLGFAIALLLVGALASAIHLSDAAGNWSVAVLLVGSVLFVERATKGMSAAQLGLDPRRAAAPVAAGIALGAAAFTAVVAELVLLQCYHVGTMQPPYQLAGAALILLPAAIVEEVLFRGVLFRLLEELSGTYIALGISAIVFGLAHGINPGTSWPSEIALALQGGLFFGAAYIATRNLWFPIGLHFAWNLFEGPIFGFPISGFDASASMIAAQISGPPLLTGGRFGPEAGVPAIVTCVGIAAVLLVRAVRARIIVPRSTRARTGEQGWRP